jgi:hypothetical protein
LVLADPLNQPGPKPAGQVNGHQDSLIIGRRDDHVAQRPLAFYQAIGESLAAGQIGGRS